MLSIIGRGAGWKVGADLLGRLLQYALLWAAARTLSQGDFGDFTFGLSAGLMLAQVADFGLQLYVQRELARLAIPGAQECPYFTDEAKAGRLIGGGLVIKSALGTAAMLLIATLIFLEPVGSKWPLLLLGLSMVLMTGLDYLSYCFRALRLLRNEAIASLVARAANLGLGMGLLYLGAGVWGLALASNLAMLLGMAFLYRRLARYVRPIWRPDWAAWRRSAAQPTAIGIGIIFSIVSFRVDNLLIPPFLGREALAVYNVAYKLFEPSLIIPGVVLATTFPLLTQAAESGGSASAIRLGTLRDLLRRTLLLLFLLGAGATFLLLIVAGPALSLLYGGQYAASVPLLRILALCCLPMYLNYGLTHALIALDRPQFYAGFTLASLLVNVGANILLIPLVGVSGAAYATFFTEIALLALCIPAVFRCLPRALPAQELVSEASL
ncbi:MAG: oligosaccharide flippase family protein [Chloroflexi bacterium]|nr:oligosaccharide flippase family protein [Chloroflexota bacterium]